VKEVQAALKFREKLGIKGDEAAELSRKAKRMFSMTLTEGAISSFLFAYSKAKNENVKKLLSNYEEYKNLEKEEGEWGLIAAFLIKEALSDMKLDGDLVNLMNKLHEKDVRMKVERATLRYLEALGKVLDAYS